ncbi:PTS galactosamine/N-acetylgalactosamine transporter subunit IIA [Cytobacillus oceanisediminis]|uniref:PTS system N-acetylgalactosamine-specific IIA component n=1 Tax=Cytobacillus oceanisediminis TaxID=665099 RepID=A0A562JJ52_9BACI|nr:PTS galactosamine/N-acetylgalactosamine transporter subunit IIA [Cytobacillus oceanisediminis]TWH83073.1 PTS system N-acetylgalactosamine-specific IIA component [Cytobacillus oceanisediminis]
MNGLIVSGHGSFASGLHSSVKLIAGEQPRIEYVDFLESDSTSDLEIKIKAALANLEGCNGILVLCDLVGGSPFKTAVSLTNNQQDAAVIGGANLAMVIETAIMKDNVSIDELKEMAITSGREAIKCFQKSERLKRDGAGI